MLVELHLIQNFAPSNLNRDDTGSPKDCEFGGYRRARISSQCLKRAVRTEFKAAHLIEPQLLAERTKRGVEAIAERLARTGRPVEEAERVATVLLTGAGFGVKDGKTEYLLFLSGQELDAVADIAGRYWDDLLLAASDAKEIKKGNTATPAEAKNAVMRALDGRRAADLALFGRMIADMPDKNVEAACQVAHALSTNRMSMEFDFYTAVDDLKPEDTAGADMLGTVEFNSACFYRYANVDIRQLMDNLGEDGPLARRTLQAFLRASVDAVPTGKQNSMAAHNPPSLVMAVVRDAGLWNLANAFLKPVQARQDGDLVQESIARLDDYWAKLTGMYGLAGVRDVVVATTEPERLKQLAQAQVRPADPRTSAVDALIEQVVARATAPRD